MNNESVPNVSNNVDESNSCKLWPTNYANQCPSPLDMLSFTDAEETNGTTHTATDWTPGCRFNAPFLFSDMIIEVEGRRFHCHRAILSLWSPVFEAMFQSSCQESNNHKIILREDKAADIAELLLHLYSPGGRDIDTETGLRLLPVVHRYQMDVLLSAVEKRLCHSISDSTALEFYKLADHYNLRNLKQSTLEKCARFDKMRLEKEMSEITVPADAQVDIYKRRINILEQVIHDIQRSLSISCIKVESKMERVPANHCSKHSRPFALNESGEPCPICVDNMKVHIFELCKKVMNKTLISRETST